MKQKDQSYLSVCLPYVRGLSESIRILRPLSIGVFFKPQSWKWTVMKGVKDERKSHEKEGVVYEMRYVRRPILGRLLGVLTSEGRSTMPTHGTGTQSCQL